MAFTTDHSTSVARIDASAAARSLSRDSSRWLETIADSDLAFVHWCAHGTRYAPVRHLAIVMSKLGNGWIYPVLAIIIFTETRWNAPWIFVTAVINAVILHIIYPMLKKRFRRRRPFQVDSGLKSLLETLDEHSFPSGHVMTLSGVLLPVTLSLPGALVPAITLMATMAWSRIATAHHFPGDVLAGALLGTMIAYPVSILMLHPT